MNGDTIPFDAATPDTCPGCGDGFRCGARDATPCWCADVTLSDTTLTALQGRYVGCLCERCLRSFSAAHAAPN